MYMDAAALSVSPDLLKAAPSAPSVGAGPLTDARRAKIAKAGADFEQQFVSQMLGQMFDGVDAEAPFGGGEGEGMFKSFLTDAMAKSMVRQGGVGLSSVIQRELLKMQGVQ